MPPDLRHIRTFKQLVRFLEDELDWPLEDHDESEIMFDYDAEELGLRPAEAAKVKSIRQLRPLSDSQPWGIFFIEFDRKRLPVVVLRRILSHLVVKKRASASKAHRAAWHAADLLFISAFGPDDDGREIGFAHFHQEDGDLPALRVLGWDGGDTVLKLNHVAATLEARLRWPEKGESIEQWRERWAGAFRHRLGHVIRTASELADAMAALAKRIRDAARTLMEHETERGPLRKLHKAFQTSLIHDLTEEQFADTYAQTITYGLLTAAISRTEMSEGRHGTALVATNVTDMVPVTNPFLREMLQTFLSAGGRRGGIDFDELGVQDVVELLRGDETDLPAILRDFGNRKPGEDPVIHFYEHFLSAYNKQLKIQRGVFYTPQPVVSYIVRSVHELLQTEFGLEDGLASTVTWGEMVERSKREAAANHKSEIVNHRCLQLPPFTDEPGEKRTISPDEPFVQILDPATGTATFLVEVIDVIHKHLEAKWKKGGAAAMPRHPSFIPHPSSFAAFWNDYVPKALLPRLHAFELMMAPYAIAHMKIGLKLAETGYRFGTETALRDSASATEGSPQSLREAQDKRARIYLTNALEPWVKQLPLIGFDALAHEAAAVNEIKRHKRFTVVIGNPPYSIRSGNLTDEAKRLIEPFKFIDGQRIVEKGALQLEKNLNDDYVKFFGLIQQLLAPQSVGIVGLITNHAFLDNLTFRGFRWNLLSQFSRIQLLDLHGNSKKKEQVPEGYGNENVFDIQQGVGISLMLRRPSEARLAAVTLAEHWGTREEKYRALDAARFDYHSIECPAPWFKMTIQDAGLAAEFNSFTVVPRRHEF